MNVKTKINNMSRLTQQQCQYINVNLNKNNIIKLLYEDILLYGYFRPHFRLTSIGLLLC